MITPTLLYFIITSICYLSGLTLPTLKPNMETSPFYSQNFDLFSNLSFLLTLSISFLSATALKQLMMIRASELYLEKDPKPMLQILREEKNRFIPLGALLILLSLIFITGSFLFIVPAIIFYLILFFTGQVFILEKKGVKASFKRSWDLTKGRKGKIFLLELLVCLIIFALMVIVRLIPMMFEPLTNYSLFLKENNSFDIDRIIKIMGNLFYSFIAINLIVPLRYAYITSIYYNILKEKEGFATVQLAETFNQQSDSQEDFRL